MPFVYLAGPSEPNQQQTFDLALHHGVIAKSFFRDKPNWEADNYLGALEENAILFLAYRNQTGELGAVIQFNLENAANNNSVVPLAEIDDVLDHYNGNPPQVFGVVNNETELQATIEELGYEGDPKINAFTVICVTPIANNAANEHILNALNEWYAELPNKKTTVHILPENVMGLE